MLEAEISMFTQRVRPAKAVRSAQQNVNSTISNDSGRLGDQSQSLRPGRSSPPPHRRVATVPQ